MWGPKGFAAGKVRPDGGVEAFVQWDGNAVWGATAYWAHLTALRAGVPERAAQLRTELETMVRDHGFREFYDSWSGAPGGAGAESGFTWPALLLEMEANEEGWTGQSSLTRAGPTKSRYLASTFDFTLTAGAVFCSQARQPSSESETGRSSTRRRSPEGNGPGSS